MRFLGNKESIVNDIEALLNEKQLIGQKLSFLMHLPAPVQLQIILNNIITSR